MKYAIPSKSNTGLNDFVEEHFGRALYFTIWDEETDSISVVANQSNHFGGTKMPAEFLSEYSQAIVCSGIGTKAIQLCQTINMKVFVGASGTIQETIEKIKAKELQEATATDGCAH